METLNKNWSNGIDASKKFLSRNITHKLSNLLDRKVFDVVFEGRLSSSDANEPDIVVYDKTKSLKPVMAIEVCNHNEVEEMISTAKRLMTSFDVSTFFIYDKDQNNWTKLMGAAQAALLDSSSDFDNVSLSETILL